MPMICIHSPKGGVGKSTLCSNLAHAFSRSGIKVLVIELDPQNSLNIHFGFPLADKRGFVSKSLTHVDWEEYIQRTSNNIFLLPYGSTTDKERLYFEKNLAEDSQFLAKGLNALLQHSGLVIIVDLPSGPSSALNAIVPFADLMLTPLLADTSSLSLLPQIEKQFLINKTKKEQIEQYFILNQVDLRRKVNRDVTAFLQENHNKKLLGLIHRDESVVEAHSRQKLIYEFNAASVAAFDIARICKKITSTLGIKIGDGAIHTQ